MKILLPLLGLGFTINTVYCQTGYESAQYSGYLLSSAKKTYPDSLWKSLILTQPVQASWPIALSGLSSSTSPVLVGQGLSGLNKGLGTYTNSDLCSYSQAILKGIISQIPVKLGDDSRLMIASVGNVTLWPNVDESILPVTTNGNLAGLRYFGSAFGSGSLAISNGVTDLNAKNNSTDPAVNGSVYFRPTVLNSLIASPAISGAYNSSSFNPSVTGSSTLTFTASSISSITTFDQVEIPADNLWRNAVYSPTLSEHNGYFTAGQSGSVSDYYVGGFADKNTLVASNGKSIGYLLERDWFRTANGISYDVMKATVSKSINPYFSASASNGIAISYQAAYQWELQGTDQQSWLKAEAYSSYHPGTFVTINTRANLGEDNAIGGYEIINGNNRFSFSTTSGRAASIGFKYLDGTSMNIGAERVLVGGSLNVNGSIFTKGLNITDWAGNSRLSLSPSSMIIGGGIGAPSAVFVLNSTSQGILISRMKTKERLAIDNPSEGLQVYDTDLKKLFLYTGEMWEMICSKKYDRPGQIGN